MTNRTITIASACKVSTRDEQIVILLPSGEEETVPAEDIACLMIESQEAVITVPALNKLTDYNTAVVFCDGRHSPNSMLLTLHANSVQTERFARQMKLEENVKDSIWRQIVQAKIRNQAGALWMLSKDGGTIAPLVDKVRDGDRGNTEGWAARLYWETLFGKDFRRERFGPAPNPMLNYGYTILRSATTRALMSTGLFPCFGIHHRSRYDDFCLSDDMMEPFRPMVDIAVYEIWDEGGKDTDRETKMRIQRVMQSEMITGRHTKRLVSALTDTCVSLLDVIEGKSDTVIFPEIC